MKRKPISDVTAGIDQRVLFHFRPATKTTEGETYAYLLHNQIFDSKRGKALANQAIVAWWLSYARQATQPQHARQTAIDCIEQMEHHIAKLRRDFGLPQQYESLPVMPTTPIEARQEAVTSESHPPSPKHQIAPALMIDDHADGTDENATVPDDTAFGMFDMLEA